MTTIRGWVTRRSSEGAAILPMRRRPMRRRHGVGAAQRPRCDKAGQRGVSPTARHRAIFVAVAACAQFLVACGGGGGGQPTLNLYLYPDNSGAVQQGVDSCSQASGGRYAIKYQKLPNGADGQRQQMVRRLAAKDSSMDILGLDVTWEAEFAEAGWIRAWTGANRAAATKGTLKAPIETATWKGKLYAVPYNSNTQLLWYRSDLVPNPPKTWDEMI